MKTGWITPQKTILECTPFEHFEWLAKSATVSPQIAEKIRSMNEELNELSADCENLMEIGEHPEWHRYEMAQYSLRADVIHLAYNEGYIRFSSYGGMIFFQGKAEFIKDRHDFMKNYAEQEDLVPKFEPF